MRVIYSHCSLCLLWFGELPEDRGFTAEDVANVFEFIRISTGLLTKVNGQQELVTKLSSPEAKTRAQLAFVALGINGNPWWSRIWTVQEAVLPKVAQLVWGPHIISWAEVQHTARNFCRGVKRVPPSLLHIFKGHLDEIISPVRGLELASEGDGPLNLLERWRYRGATDPRDKIFALMGLFSQSPFPSLKSCDYNLSLQTVYTNVMVDLIDIEQGLRPLVGIRNPSTIGLPTWVSDFSSVPNIETRERWWNHAHRYARCAADDYTDFTYSYLPQFSALELTGIRVDGVGEVNEQVLKVFDYSIVDEHSLIKVLSSWSKDTNWDAPGFGSIYVGGDLRSNAFGATLIGDFLMAECPTRGATRDEHHEVFQYATTGTGMLSRELSCSLRSFVINQSFFVTEEGYIGMGPQTMAPGDELWILFGGKVPFILRPFRKFGKGADGYTLVGHAFVYGIMDGEVVKTRRAEQTVIRLY